MTSMATDYSVVLVDDLGDRRRFKVQAADRDAAVAAARVEAAATTAGHRPVKLLSCRRARTDPLPESHRRAIARGLAQSTAHVGRPPYIGDEIKDRVRALRQAGASYRQIAREIGGISPSSAHSIIAATPPAPVTPPPAPTYRVRHRSRPAPAPIA
jgi:hypothetical protein